MAFRSNSGAVSLTLVDSNDRNMVIPLNKNISMALSYIKHSALYNSGVAVMHLK